MKMKTKSKISKKSKNERPHQKAPSTTRERKFWTMRVEPMERIMISKYLDRCLMVIQNHGPGKISVDNGNLDRVELMPGKLLVTAAGGQIDVESKDENSALIECEFTPTVK
jgi:hypothetical protein